MDAFCTEFFGRPQQQDLQRRADLVWAVLKDDPAYACHGRAVSLAGATEANVATQIALARLQGVCGVEGVPADAVRARRGALEASGLGVDQFVNWRGGPEALKAAGEVARGRRLAPELEVVSVDGRTPREDLAKLDALTQSCGVLLPMGAFIRGQRRPAVCLFARDRSGRVIGSAASVAQFHPDHPKAALAWWGMLATDEARRGEGIALILGAQSMLAMRDRFGYEAFFTGVRAGNAPSEALCRKLRLVPTPSVDLIAVDADALSCGRLTG